MRICAHLSVVYATWAIDKCACTRFAGSSQSEAIIVTALNIFGNWEYPIDDRMKMNKVSVFAEKIRSEDHRCQSLEKIRLKFQFTLAYQSKLEQL